MIRVYIAGPMTGYPDFNRPAFFAKAKELREQGFHVENPAENHAPCGTWEGYMRLAIGQIITCSRMVMLPGWENSRGATIEHKLALDLGMLVSFA